MSKRTASDIGAESVREHIVSVLEADVIAINKHIVLEKTDLKELQKKIDVAATALAEANAEYNDKKRKVHEATLDKKVERDMLRALAKIVNDPYTQYVIVTEFDATNGASLIKWLKGQHPTPPYSTLVIDEAIHDMFKRGCKFTRGYMRLDIEINRRSYNRDHTTSYKVECATVYNPVETGPDKNITKNCVLHDDIKSSAFMDAMLHCESTGRDVQADGSCTRVDVECMIVTFDNQ